MLVHARAGVVILEDNGFSLILRVDLKQQNVPNLTVHFEPASSDTTFDKNFEAVVGCIGILRHSDEMFVVLIKSSRPASNCSWGGELIEDVIFYSVETGIRYTQATKSRKRDVGFSSIQSEVDISDLAKFMSHGSFFFSTSKTWDVTLNLAEQARLVKKTREGLQPKSRRDTETLNGINPPAMAAGVNMYHINSDPDFIWNLFLLSPLFEIVQALEPDERVEFQKRHFALVLCQGFFGSRSIQSGKNKDDKVLIQVISRRKWTRAGTRFNVRGIDKFGNCANAAETETILHLENTGTTMSFVQARASVPVLWQESLSIKGDGPNVAIHQPINDSIEPLKIHFKSLLNKYKGKVHILNTIRRQLGCAEERLGAAYAEAVQAASDQDKQMMDDVLYREFDMHRVWDANNTVPQQLRRTQQHVLNEMRWTEAKMDWQGKVDIATIEQQGVFRINCRDCLDRTTLAGFVLSEATLEAFLAQTSRSSDIFKGSELDKAHRELFADSGDVLSKIYAGSAAMTSSFIRSGHASHLDVVVHFKINRERVNQALLWDKLKQTETNELTGQTPER
ncbi:Inositol-1,4,5-trisphosphate 5-phosphatase 1 [Microbotryomycetes sp. JL221]|nr:Inositol-1,4,5-trisphosphate 5-phosphatase 1 [Microbotryomycetes sp. JL221]